MLFFEVFINRTLLVSMQQQKHLNQSKRARKQFQNANVSSALLALSIQHHRHHHQIHESVDLCHADMLSVCNVVVCLSLGDGLVGTCLSRLLQSFLEIHLPVPNQEEPN